MNAQELLQHYAQVRARLMNPPNGIKPPKLRLVVKNDKPRLPHKLDKVRYTHPIGPELPSKLQLDGVEIVTPTAKAILFEVARKHGLSPVELVGNRRQKNIIAARFEAIVRIADEKPDWSLVQIGNFFNRDHTTVLHAIRKVKGTERDGRKITSTYKQYGGQP